MIEFGHDCEAILGLRCPEPLDARPVRRCPKRIARMVPLDIRDDGADEMVSDLLDLKLGPRSPIRHRRLGHIDIPLGC
jgi:hypothetical protein